MTKSRLLAAAAASALVVVGLVGCAPPEKKDTGNQTESGVNAKEATSAADFGGMDGLVKAAKAEGELNVIALPPDWANYKEIIDTFSSKYGIKVNSAQPDANSQDEINAANQQKGKSTAPDVFDLGQAIALANTNLFAPYKVATFDSIPEQFKDPDGTWVNDYGGYSSIGYDSAKVPEIKDFNDLLKPEFKGKVALNGDPTTASAAANGVLMAAIANGGIGGRHRSGRQLLRQAQGSRQLRAGRPDARDHRIRPDARRHRLGLPECGRDQEDPDLEGVRTVQRARRWLLLPGDQQGRTPPCRSPALAGVPLQRRGAEPLPEGPRATGARGRDGKGRHRRQEPAQARCPRSRAPRSSRPTRRARRWRSTSEPTGPR